MMPKHKSRMNKSRDLGIPGPPGKGDDDRTSDRVAFNENFSEVVFPDAPPEGFRKLGNKIVKKYS